MPVGTGGILNITDLAASMKKNGVSDADIAFALTPDRQVSQMRSSEITDQGLTSAHSNTLLRSAHSTYLY